MVDLRNHNLYPVEVCKMFTEATMVLSDAFQIRTNVLFISTKVASKCRLISSRTFSTWEISGEIVDHGSTSTLVHGGTSITTPAAYCPALSFSNEKAYHRVRVNGMAYCCMISSRYRESSNFHR